MEELKDSIAKGDFESVDNQKQRLISIAKQNEAFIGNGYVDPLEAALLEKQQIQAELKEGEIELIAPFAGMINFKTDGLEEVLLPQNLTEVRPEQLLNTEINIVEIPLNTKETRIGEPVFKIIDNFEFYIVTDLPKQVLENKTEGSFISLYIDENPNPVLFKIDTLIPRDKDNLLILKTNQDVPEQLLSEYEFVDDVSLEGIDLGTGVANLGLKTEDSLFYKVLSETSGIEVKGDYMLIGMLKDLCNAKREYDKVAKALIDVRETGYGIVPPVLSEMELEEPELIRQGNRFGVKLRASAPSIHMIRADIQTEVSPIIGTEKQSEELVNYLLKEFETDPQKIWETNIFGKSLNDLVREGIQNKLHNMPETAQIKLAETVQRIVNEGSGALICIIL
jgi:hypothetical protein